MHLRSRGSMPEVCTSSSLVDEREQGMPGARCTRGLVCHMHKEKRTRAYRFSGSSPAFPAQWFYGLSRALPGDRLSCHRRSREALASHKLDTSIGVSGPHDFAVRFSTVRLSALSRPPHPAPNVRDDRDTPLLWARDGGVIGVIWGEREAEYFSQPGWTGFSDLPVGQSHRRSHNAGS